MNGETFQCQVTVNNPQGLHMRPLTAFAELAGKFQSTVTVIKEGQRINGKSPLELLCLAAEYGTLLTLEATGPDARAALDALVELLNTLSTEDTSEPPLPQKG
jgi:phosphocarrier protein